MMSSKIPLQSYEMEEDRYIQADQVKICYVTAVSVALLYYVTTSRCNELGPAV